MVVVSCYHVSKEQTAVPRNRNDDPLCHIYSPPMMSLSCLDRKLRSINYKKVRIERRWSVFTTLYFVFSGSLEPTLFKRASLSIHMFSIPLWQPESTSLRTAVRQDSRILNGTNAETRAYAFGSAFQPLWSFGTWTQGYMDAHEITGPGVHAAGNPSSILLGVTLVPKIDFGFIR